MINLDLKDKDKLDFITFLNSEKKLAFSLIIFLVEEYKKEEKINFFNDERLDISIELTEEDIKYIFKYAETIDMTKKDSSLTNNRTTTEENFIDHIKYIILEENIIDIMKFKYIIREYFINISLDDPTYLAENIKINMQNIMDREITKENNVTSEIMILKALNEETMKLSSINKNHLELNINASYIDKEYIEEFSNNILENISREVFTISQVNIALTQKTDEILSYIEDISIGKQLSYISLYLERTRKSLKQFFNKEYKSSMNYYMQKLNIYFEFIKGYTYNKDSQWRTIKMEYEREVDILIDTIEFVIFNLENMQNNLMKKSNIETYMEQFKINEDYDKGDRKKEKIALLNKRFGIKLGTFSKKMTIKKIDNDIIKNLWIDAHRVKEVLSDEAIEEAISLALEKEEIDKEKLKEERDLNIKRDKAFKELYQYLLNEKDNIKLDTFKDDSKEVFDKIYDEKDISLIFKDLYTEEEIIDKRILYRCIEKLFQDEYSKIIEGELI